MLVDFFATWCNPCKAMDAKTFRDPEVVRALEEVVPVRIDAEGTEPVHGYVGEALASRYRVVSYPTLILMDGDGREIARSRGYKSPTQFLAWLRSALPATAVEVQSDDPADPARDPAAM
jgi:thiol:disulfide interchange protein DsbD